MISSAMRNVDGYKRKLALDGRERDTDSRDAAEWRNWFGK
jgi:hypothetical protein